MSKLSISGVAFLAGVSLVVLAFGLRTPHSFSTEAGATDTATPPNGDTLQVVELFTSEGCSSCPPADRVLASLTDDDGVLPLAFHVDYWDRLGWKDRFAARDYTRRQYEYAQLFESENVYTPQAIVGGTNEVLGSDERAVRRLIELVPRGDATPLDVEWSRRGDVVDVRAATSSDAFRVNVVVVEPAARTVVERGENRGRTLTHANIVRDLAVVTPSLDGTVTATVQIPDDASDPFIAVYVQASDGRILNARRMAL